MRKAPLATILTAAYNQGSFLAASLDSALAQDLPAGRWEVLVVDDGSTDETPEILRRYAGRVRVVSQPNRGLAAACNAGIAEARGAFLARLDSDDTVSPRWLSALLKTLESRDDAALAYCDRYECFPDGRRELARAPENDLYGLVACGTLFRTEDLRRIGGFRPLFWEEYDLYLRLRTFGPFLRVPEPLYHYRRHPGGMTGDPERRRRGWLELVGLWGAQALREAGRHPELEAACLSAKP